MTFVNEDGVILRIFLFLVDLKSFITLHFQFSHPLSQQFFPGPFPMSPPYARSSIPLYSFFFMILISNPLVQLLGFGWALDEGFANHGELTCGEMDAAFPLRIAGPKDYCFHPSYELECLEDKVVVTIMSQKYEVLRIAREKQSMIIVGMDLLKNKRPEQADFVLDKSLLSLTDNDSEATLFYNCDPPVGPNSSHFHCLMGDDFPVACLLNMSDHRASQCAESCRCNISIPILILKSLISHNPDNVIHAEKVLKDGFKIKWVLDMKECKNCPDSKRKCAYNTTSKIFSCFSPDGAHGSTCPGPSHYPANHQAPTPEPTEAQSSRRTTLKLFMGIGIAIGAAALSLATVLYWLRKSKSTCLKGHPKIDRDIENFISENILLAQRFTNAGIRRMTNSFREKLGQGGCGSVYKGLLSDGTVVAVKVWNSTRGSGEEFMNEVAGISRTSHVNIVSLLGFCFEGRKRALIYEFMPNASLDRFIHNENGQSDMRLGWEKLYMIAVGIAKGLEYLHRGCRTRILHFDIKPHNILLDEDFNPKISDFGLSKLCLERESFVSMMAARGTIGYIAPEVFSRNFGRVSYKADVYSYGMILIEMIARRNNLNAVAKQSSEIYFSDWVYRLVEQGYDQELHGELMGEEELIARKMALVGVWCIQTDPTQRPSMSRVIEMLEGSIESLQIPPKPFLFSPHRSPKDSSSSTPMLL